MSTYERILGLSGPLDPERLLLFDGHSLAYRAFFAIRDLSTRSGDPVNAVFGFWRALLKTLRSYPSVYTAVVFDAGGKTFRHRMYEPYKATRKPIPDDLARQLPLIGRLLDGLGVPFFATPGVEADDILASIATRAAAGGLDVLISTGDKDMAQIVTDRIALLQPSGRSANSRDDVLDPPGVERKYGVPPGRIVDLLALVGDSSDNVPGVPGVGQKTARQLLDEFGSLDALFERVDEVRNARIRDRLKTNVEAARLSRRLVTLKIDEMADDVPGACRLRGADVDRLCRFFTEVEFASVIDELGLRASPDDSLTSRDGRVAEYRAVLDVDTLQRVVEELWGAEAVSVDLETTSVDPMRAEIVGIAVSPAPYVGYYIPVKHDALGAPPQIPLGVVLDALRPILVAESPVIVGQNFKYDWIVLCRHGVVPQGVAFDAMIASHLVHPEARRHSLEEIARTVLGYRMSTYEEVAGRGGSFAAVPVDDATRYAAEDAEIVQRLRAPLERAVRNASAERLFREVELPLIGVLARMEAHGILLDQDALREQGEELRRELAIIEADLTEIAGEPFNAGSPRQVAEILFHKLGLPVIERTKTGPSTSARVLAELAVHHPLPGKLMAHRELKKLLTTYIDQLPRSVNPRTGRIHTTFHQTSTATGRLSSSDPNLQNIPTRTEFGGRIRRAFIAPEGAVLVATDYSQIELRLLAHLSGDETMISAFRDGVDLHRLTASHVFGLPESRVDSRMRDAAKRVNFGIIYGISAYGLARDLAVSRSDAQSYIDRFFAAYPRARAYIDELIERATRCGYAETLLGRRRPLPHLTSGDVARRNFDRRNAVNTPIQGGAADLIKQAMIAVDRRIEGDRLPARMILQIHDELVFEVPASEVSDLVPELRAAMEQAMALRVPLEVKTSVGRDWGEL